jgi:hypothetical protein
MVGSYKATEEQQNIKFLQIIEYVVDNEYFIHRRLHELSILLPWFECAGDMISLFAYRLSPSARCQLLWCEPALRVEMGIT